MSVGSNRVPDYVTERERLREFFNEFKSDGETSKYLECLDLIRSHRSEVLEIALDDVQSYNRELCKNIINNTVRYRSIILDVADELIGDVQFDFNNPAEVMAATRMSNYTDNKDPTSNEKPPFPPELHRRYSLLLLPPTKQQTLPMREIKASSIGHLVKLRGLVTRITQVKPEMRVAVYRCSQCNEETFQTITGPRFMPLRDCPSLRCRQNPNNGSLTLSMRYSKFEKFQLIRIQELANEVPAGHIPRSMSVHARVTLTQICQTGDVIEVDGIFLPRPLKSTMQSLVSETYLEAQNIAVCSKETAEEEEAAPSNYEALASSIAPEIFGLEDVKKALLLQLVGGETKQFEDGVRIRGDINICLMGDPGVAKSQLLKWVARIAPRSVYTTGKGSSGVGLTAAVVKDTITGEMSLEGGALVLSDMGVCCIDEFDKMDDGDRTAIYEVMEQQTVSISKAGINTTLNARTAILAAANPIHSHYNLKKSIIENVNLPTALLSRFDLLFLLLDKPSIESDMHLASHIAFVHQNREAPKSTSAVSVAQLRSQIRNAKTVSPVIPDELNRYISAAYVNMRQEKNGAQATPRALLAILRLAMALARIRHAKEVNAADVDEALRLFQASKESVELNTVDTRHAKDITGDIYSKITENWKGQETVSMSELKKFILQNGYTMEQLDKTIDEYSRLSVWETNPSRTKLHFVSQE
mgnify:CR=1 FL=1